MGFRGEALSSISSVAEVELKTRKEESELGTQIIIRGGEFIKQERTSCSVGCNFLVKNLFYNVPARRKFLKADSTELRNIITDFQRISLTYPEIKFRLINNDTEIFNLPVSNLRQRIINIFGKQLNSKIVNVDCETSIAKIHGFTGDPQKAKRKYGEQFFFVNGRFMKHPYLHKSIMNAYDKLLPTDSIPSYFIYFEVDPKIIDINIHPTKTEIKFEDEQALFQILNATVRESLGKFNIIPSIDFDEDNSIDIPSLGSREEEISAPKIRVNSNYNPFEENNTKPYNPFDTWDYQSTIAPDIENFENYKIEEAAFEPDIQPEKRIFQSKVNNSNFGKNPEVSKRASSINQTRISSFNNEEKKTDTKQYIQLKNRYIITQVKSGLMMIDQKRAHEKIIYENIITSMENHKGTTQQSLFPETIELDAKDFNIILSLLEDLRTIGFNIEPLENNTITINGTPSEIENCPTKRIIEELIQHFKDTQSDIKTVIKEDIALSITKSSTTGHNKTLTTTEINNLIDNLFACPSPNYTPDGKQIVTIIEMNDIKSLLK